MKTNCDINSHPMSSVEIPAVGELEPHLEFLWLGRDGKEFEQTRQESLSQAR